MAADGRVGPQPIGKPSGDGKPHRQQHQRDGQRHGEALLHQIPGLPLLPRADSLGHLNGEAYRRRAAHAVEQV